MKIMKWLLICVLCMNAFVWGIDVREEDAFVVLTSSSVEYRFNCEGLFDLVETKYNGCALPLKQLRLTYRMQNGDWYSEDNINAPLATPERSYRIERSAGEITFETIAKGKRMTITRRYTVREGTPELFFNGKVELTGERSIDWFNMFSTTVPAGNKMLFLTSKEENGKITPRLHCKAYPFTDESGKIHRTGNFDITALREIFMAGAWDPTLNVGLLVRSKQAKVMWTITMSYNIDSKNHGISMTCRNFDRRPDGVWTVSANAIFMPFKEAPEMVEKTVLPAYVAELRERHLIPTDYSCANLLKQEADFSLWQDFPETKIFQNTQAPEPNTKKEYVELFACRDEGESFQLAFRPASDKADVTVRVVGFEEQNDFLKWTWHPIGSEQREYYLGTISAITGNVPDVLLNEQPILCKAGFTQPFLVKVKVSDNAKPGKYAGHVEISSGKTVLARVPVILNVYGFSIAEPTMTAAFDFWDKKVPDGPRKKEIVNKIEKLIVEARGGKRWVGYVRKKHDADGKILSIDYREFDASVEHALKVYRHRLIFVHMFCLGWGGIPRNTWFGPADTILSPMWKTRAVEFARDLRAHLIAKGWNDYVIMDLFDEPFPQYVHLLSETVKLIHQVAPEWRFTYAGDYYYPELADTIKFWGHVMARLTPNTKADMLATGGEISVYNPHGYSDNESALHQRGSYIWLWNNNIRYIYQWVINCWSDIGQDGWDYYRCASWVVPGEDGMPLGTLRLESTRNGIEDFEYLSLLRECANYYKDRDPFLHVEAQRLMDAAGQLAWMPAGGEISVLVSFDPQAFHNWHRAVGNFLDQHLPESVNYHQKKD